MAVSIAGQQPLVHCCLHCWPVTTHHHGCLHHTTVTASLANQQPASNMAVSHPPFTSSCKTATVLALALGCIVASSASEHLRCGSASYALRHPETTSNCSTTAVLPLAVGSPRVVPAARYLKKCPGRRGFPYCIYTMSQEPRTNNNNNNKNLPH